MYPMYLYRDYFKAKVQTIWVHGPLGYSLMTHSDLGRLSGIFRLRVKGIGVRDDTLTVQRPSSKRLNECCEGYLLKSKSFLI